MTPGPARQYGLDRLRQRSGRGSGARSTHPGPALVPRKARSLPGQPEPRRSPARTQSPRSGPQGRSCRRRSTRLTTQDPRSGSTQGPRWYPGRPAAAPGSRSLPGQPGTPPEPGPRSEPPQRPPGPQLPPEILRQHSPEAAAAGSLKSKPRNTYKLNPHFVHR